MKRITDDDFLKKMGWKLVDGYKVETDVFDGDYQFCFFEDLDEFVIRTKFWKHNVIEACYDDVDSLLENEYEEYLDDG